MMILELTTTHKPATGLGLLPHKHPDKQQTIGLSVANGISFPAAYSEAVDSRS